MIIHTILTNRNGFNRLILLVDVFDELLCQLNVFITYYFHILTSNDIITISTSDCANKKNDFFYTHIYNIITIYNGLLYFDIKSNTISL